MYTVQTHIFLGNMMNFKESLISTAHTYCSILVHRNEHTCKKNLYCIRTSSFLTIIGTLTTDVRIRVYFTSVCVQKNPGPISGLECIWPPATPPPLPLTSSPPPPPRGEISIQRNGVATPVGEKIREESPGRRGGGGWWGAMLPVSRKFGRRILKKTFRPNDQVKLVNLKSAIIL